MATENLANSQLLSNTAVIIEVAEAVHGVLIFSLQSEIRLLIWTENWHCKNECQMKNKFTFGSVVRANPELTPRKSLGRQ